MADVFSFELRTPIVKLDKVRIALLKEKISHPNITTRKLSEVLKKKYSINLSHTRISEILKEMKDKEIYREAIIPNENYFIFAFVEFSFNNENFKDNWRKAYEYLMDSPNVLFFFATDGIFRWKFIMVFRSFQEVSRWLHNFMKNYGELVKDININLVYKVLKFKFDEKLLDFESI